MNGWKIVSSQEIYDDLNKDPEESDRSYDEWQDFLDNEVDYVKGWHLTSHRLLNSIREEGLLTRHDSGVDSEANNEGSDIVSFPDRVYFKIRNDAMYESADTRLLNRIGGRSMRVEALLEPRKLLPDEDSYHDEFLGSIKYYGTFAHNGSVSPDLLTSASHIIDYEIGDEVWIPTIVKTDVEQNFDEDKQAEILDELTQRYDTQIDPYAASWLMNYNKLRRSRIIPENDPLPNMNDDYINFYHKLSEDDLDGLVTLDTDFHR